MSQIVYGTGQSVSLPVTVDLVLEREFLTSEHKEASSAETR